ncbi:MAG: alpha/beta fold hydrolase [Rhodospirillales bacterium]|nr:alpha/beta fold hydrolase [Rhodospirillales bacterium]
MTQDPMRAAPVPEPAATRALRDAARRHETPNGAGRMVWHGWGDPAAAPLVLLHGGAGSWRHWVRNIADLAREFHVLAGDVPGLGESGTPPEPHTAERVSGIIADGIAALLGTTRYHLAGFSFGGVMAGCVAARHGGQVRTVSIAGSGGLGLARGITPLMKVRHLEGAARVAAHRHNLAALMIADPAKIDAAALEIQDWNTRHARLRTPLISRSPALYEALGAIRAPLAGIYGACDATCLPDLAARATVFRERQPGATFEVIEGAGHWVQYEAADAYAAALRRSLARG